MGYFFATIKMYSTLFLLLMGFVILDVNPERMEKDQYLISVPVGVPQSESIIVLDSRNFMLLDGCHANFERWKEKIIKLINVVIKFIKKLFDLLRRLLVLV